MAELQVDPGAIAADGSTVLQAADQLTALRGDIRSRSFGGETVAAAEAGYADFASRWRSGAAELASAVESLGQAVKGAAELYRLTEDANVRRP